MTRRSDDGRRLIDLAGGAPAPRGGGLKHSGGAWTRAAEAAESLCTHMGHIRGEFAAAHEGLAAGAEGLRAAEVLRTVRMSWERRIEAATRECASLAGKMRTVVKEQGENEGAIRASFTASFARSGGPGGGAR
ncbi:hypothetical protein ABZ707_11005 [Streptomyces sp. NPDC006923]|uniref:hypothetical protein n=1 Tax=Streptomyces sp. NPDC006923 TaxID=3155355 RepID=UPI0033C39289